MPRDMDEFRQELLEEARADELQDYALRNDYDYFLKHYSDLIAGFLTRTKSLRKLMKPMATSLIFMRY